MFRGEFSPLSLFILTTMFKHAQLHHPGTVPVFQFQAEKFFPDATSAQIYEGVSINHSPSADGYLMNSKAEYQQGEVARVVLVRGLAEWLVFGCKEVLPWGGAREGKFKFPGVWNQCQSIRLSRNSFESGGGGRAATGHSVLRGDISSFTPGRTIAKLISENF